MHGQTVAKCNMYIVENLIICWPFDCCLLPKQILMSAAISKTMNETTIWPGQPNKVIAHTFSCGQAQLPQLIISSPEPKTHWWAYSMDRPPSSVSSVRRPHSLNIFSSETTGSIVQSSHCTLFEISTRTESFFKFASTIYKYNKSKRYYMVYRDHIEPFTFPWFCKSQKVLCTYFLIWTCYDVILCKITMQNIDHIISS